MAARSERRTRHQHLLALAPLGAAILLAVTGCEINQPQMPSFDTSFVVPLGTERLTVMDAVDSEDFLLVNPDGSLGFQLSGEADTLALDFDLSVAVPDQHVAQGLGTFSLPALDPLSWSFELGTFWAPANGTDSVTVPVPAFPIAISSGANDIPDLETATLSAGELTLAVTNNLTVPISADSGPDQLVISLADGSGGTVFAVISLPSIAPGESHVGRADLAGAVLPGDVSVTLEGGSPGSEGQFVTISGSDAIAVEAAFAGLLVTAATAVVDAQSFATGFSVPLPDDYAVMRAVIASGAVNLELVNGLPLTCTVDLVWPQIRDLDGNPLQGRYVLDGGGTTSTSLDFSGCTVQAAGGALTELSAQLSITTASSLGLPVTITAADGLGADLTDGGLTFSSVTGVVPAFDVPLDPITENIDLPAQMDGLTLTAARLQLTLTNAAGIPADLDLTLSGTAAGGTVRTLAVAERIEPAVGRTTATTTIVLDQTNSTILDFLNNLPTTITLSGSVVAGGGETGTVHADDFAVVAWEISAPMEVVVSGATLNSDPAALDIDADLRGKIGTHARGAVLRTEILNHLPLAVQLRFVADTDTARLAAAPLLVVGPLTVQAAAVDPTTHIVSQPVTSRPVLTLTEEQARLLGTPGLYTRIEALLPDNGGQPVRIMSTDYIEFRGVVELEVLIDDEL